MIDPPDPADVGQTPPPSMLQLGNDASPSEVAAPQTWQPSGTRRGNHVSVSVRLKKEEVELIRSMTDDEVTLTGWVRGLISRELRKIKKNPISDRKVDG